MWCCYNMSILTSLSQHGGVGIICLLYSENSLIRNLLLNCGDANNAVFHFIFKVKKRFKKLVLR